MDKRKLPKRALREQLMYTHTVKCLPCGERHTWAGKNTYNAQYYCRKCMESMPLTEKAVRTKEEADLILDNLHLAEECMRCGRSTRHHVTIKNGAYFLMCLCGEELVELDSGEVKT